jgi:hypothetical protein
VSVVSFVVKLLLDHQGHKGHDGHLEDTPAFSGLRSCPWDAIQNVIFKLN